jgi:hypothetical protein
MLGTSLSDIKRNCAVVYRGAENDDPRAFNDRSWMGSFVTVDGRTIYTLVHNEFHGHRRRNLCPSGSPARCWYNAITLAKSTDGGQTFARPENALVAAPTQRYEPDAPRRIGPSSPSNIIMRGDWFYFLFVDSTSESGGHICLARSASVEDAGSWYAWDGSSFAIPLALNPYESSPRKPCRPLVGLISGSLGSTTARSDGKEIILLQVAGATPNRPSGVYYSVSDDLISWTKPRLLLGAPTYRPANCGDGETVTIGYPSLMDPESSSRVFATVGRTSYLFVIRRLFKGCRGTMNRELIRFSIAIDEG